MDARVDSWMLQLTAFVGSSAPGSLLQRLYRTQWELTNRLTLSSGDCEENSGGAWHDIVA